MSAFGGLTVSKHSARKLCRYLLDYLRVLVSPDSPGNSRGNNCDRFVPKADLMHRSKQQPIRSPRRRAPAAAQSPHGESGRNSHRQFPQTQPSGSQQVHCVEHNCVGVGWPWQVGGGTRRTQTLLLHSVSPKWAQHPTPGTVHDAPRGRQCGPSVPPLRVATTPA